MMEDYIETYVDEEGNRRIRGMFTLKAKQIKELKKKYPYLAGGDEDE
jgi:DNA-binding PadR family transcriptional regulator